MQSKIYTIETIVEWNKLSIRLQENGYRPWQYQYGHWCPEGLHVWFGKAGKEYIEVVTHSEEVHAAIYKFSAKEQL